MLRNFAAALLATALIAGPAFAAEQSGNTGKLAAPAPSAMVGADGKAAVSPAQPAKHLRKHVRSHTRKHVAHRSIHRTKTAHHFKAAKTHKAYVAPMTGSAKSRKAAGVESPEMRATRSN